MYHLAQIPHFGYVLFGFPKCPFKNIGQAHKGATATAGLSSRAVFGSLQVLKRLSRSVSPRSIWAAAAMLLLPIPLSVSHGWNPGILLHQLFAIDFPAHGLKLPARTL